MRTPQQVQKQRVEYFISEIEQVLVHNSFPSLEAVTQNVGWLANRCIELLLEKMDNHTKLEVAKTVIERHPEWFKKET